MNVKAFSLVACGLVLASGYAGTAHAQTKIVRNPLYDLKPDICHLKEEGESKVPVEASAITLWDGKSDFGTIAFSPNAETRSADRPFAVVKRTHLIQKMLDRYPVKLDYARLAAGEDVSRVLADAVAPCSKHDLPDENIAPDQAAADEKRQKEQCIRDALYKGDEVRFKDKSANLRFRRALLRLFKVARTGSSRDFIVVRRKTEDFDVDPPRLSDVKPDDLPWNTLTYEPLVDAAADDAMIRRFIKAETDEMPFLVLCRGGTDASFTVLDKKTADELTRYHPAKVWVDRPAPTVFKTVDNEPAPVPVPNVILTVGDFGKLGEALNDLKTGSTRPFPTYDRTIKLAVVEGPAEFIKNTPSAASIGLTEDAAGDTISAKAAIGIRTQFKTRSEGTSQITHSFIPFISIEQEPTDFAFFQEIVTSAGVVRPRPRRATKKIAFANLTAGLRYEFEQDSPVIKTDQSGLFPTDPLGLDIGQRIPGWRLGVTGEYVTDNFQFQRGERYGFDLSFPRWMDVSGFRMRQAISEPSRRGQRDNLLNRLSSGWSLEWDNKLAVDYIDWDEDRSPFNFDTPQPDDRIGNSVFNTWLVGTDFSLKLRKANTFGAILGDSWLTITADYNFRHGYNDSLDAMGNPVTNRNAHRFEFGADFSHSDFSNLSFGVDFATGENFKTLAEAENVTFNVKAKY